MNFASKLVEKLFPTSGLLWDSSNGTAMRNPNPIGPRYIAKPLVKKKSNARPLTEAEDNAIGRSIRRRQNKKLRGWLPFCKR